MLSATFMAFQDELEKIAESSVLVPIPKRKPAGMHLESFGERGSSVAQSMTVAGKGQATPAAHELSKTVQRPTAAPHPAPHVAPHPVSAPGGSASLLRRGGALMRTHAAPLAVGAGVTALGAMALHKMRQSNAPPR
jgi:hypothetical protein